MASRQAAVLVVALAGTALALGALAGCGSSGSGGSTSGAATTGAGAAKGKYAIEQEAQSRGIKGESPTTEASTSLRISAGDCARLAVAVAARLGRPIGHAATPTPPLSKCRLAGHGIAINVFLDSGFAAHQRYLNRMVETEQFGTPDPRKVPHPVAGVGDKSAYNQDANWVPADSTLFAVRGNRWLTVAYSVSGKGNRESRQEAADLARLAFRLSAG